MPSPDSVSTFHQPRRGWRSVRRVVVAGVMALACIPAAHSGAASLSENFDGPGAPGWMVKNNSTSPSGTFGWGFGNPTVFPAYNGAPGSYLSASYQSTTAVSGATISNWLMTPLMFGLSEGDTISFYTRKPSADFPDRLEVRMSTNGWCYPGTSEADVGDFETLLLSINPTLVTGGYPFVWTRYEVTLPPMTPGRGCVGFRYYVTNAGSSAPNSDYIGIDQVDVVDRAGDITPDTTIETGVSGTVGPDAAVFTYAGTPSDGVASYECRLISADEPAPELASCPTPGREYEDLAAGEYTFEVRAVSVDGNVDPTPATREFTVDATAPDTSISSGPDGLVGSADATFTYDGDPSEDVAGFDCRLTLEGATPTTFATCPSAGRDFADLSDGTYLFEVRAVDGAGNADPSPATREFIVDTTAPDTTLTDGPSGTVATNDVSFGFSGTPVEDVDGLECRLRSGADEDPAFGACDSSTAQGYDDLADGTYTFEVRAKDAVDNADSTPASREFTVDTTPPDTEITSGPPALGSASEVTFVYAASPAEDDVAFECRLIGPSAADPEFNDCSPGEQSFAVPADGEYRFEVRARDEVGNADPTPAVREFTVDTVAPDTEITSGPSGLVASSAAAFEYVSVVEESGVTFECRLIGPSAADPEFESCATSGESYDLADGEYRFEVRAQDEAGNVDPTPATREFTLDTTAPTATITSAPTAAITDGAATFVFATTPADPSATFECRLNGATDVAFAECPGGTKSYTGLDDGTYVFEVRATDAAGNVQATPAAATITVKRPVTPPITPPVTPPAAPETKVAPPTEVATPRPPTLSPLRLSRASFIAKRSGPTLTVPGRSSLADGRSSTLTFSATPASTVEFRVERVAGRGWKPLDGVVPRYVDGDHRATFRGRFDGETLKPGRYRLVAVAVDQRTKLRSAPRTVGFRITAR